MANQNYCISCRHPSWCIEGIPMEPSVQCIRCNQLLVFQLLKKMDNPSHLPCTASPTVCYCLGPAIVWLWYSKDSRQSWGWRPTSWWWVEGVSLNRIPLDGLQPRGNGCYANGKAVIHARPYHGIEGELELANVADSNSAGARGGCQSRHWKCGGRHPRCNMLSLCSQEFPS